ncbi:hypothetical protein SAMN06265360_11413 [Haloechinothrix alba]|uniref:Uncharacterized protein n=1 Tax=Haloechinothrix alba TaxID=664784 RepID=A0A238Y7X9_9PSEU|nr:hypothetical protein SAMN06265360_11413 [Haloechinothrix alba]
MNGIAIRPATEDELGTVAQLRWNWVLENNGPPAVTREEFMDGFASWARENAVTHRCVVMVRDDEIIGMAWLAVIQRVPTARSRARATVTVRLRTNARFTRSGYVCPGREASTKCPPRGGLVAFSPARSCGIRPGSASLPRTVQGRGAPSTTGGRAPFEGGPDNTGRM